MSVERKPQGTMGATVGNVRLTAEGAQHTLSASISTGETSHDVWFRSSRGPIADGGDAWLAAGLVPAMAAGGRLRIDAPVSTRLLASAPRIQEIFHNWYPALEIIPVEARRAPVQSAPARGVACFFSGGVDSFYSLLKHRDEIDSLVFVHGLDIRLDNTRLRQNASRAIREIAQEFQKTLVEVETNLRDFSDRYTLWAPEYCGAALASVALLLSPQFRKVYIASGASYRTLHPWGSHPLVDPLWSTETMEVVHDGCEANRIDKIRALASSDAALRSLRVCWQNRNGNYNCGACEKCLRTMVGLRAVGALDRSTAFPRRLSLAAVSCLPLPDAVFRSYFEENLRTVEAHGHDPALEWALRICLNKPRQGIWRLARGAHYRIRRLLGRTPAPTAPLLRGVGKP